MITKPASPPHEPADLVEPVALEPTTEVPARDPVLPRDRWPFLRADSPVPTVVGLAVAGLGFVLILIGWGQAAGETAVALQLPYVVSGGVLGLALVVVGLTAVTVQYKRHDAATLQRQLEELTAIVARLAAAERPAHDEQDG